MNCRPQNEELQYHWEYLQRPSQVLGRFPKGFSDIETDLKFQFAIFKTPMKLLG